MQHIYGLQEKLVDRLDTYEKEYRKNPNAVKIQIIQPLFNYAFFSEEQCISFLLFTDTIPDDEVERVKAICLNLNLEGGIITDGFAWAYVNSKGKMWEFRTDDSMSYEKFVPLIMHLTVQNMVDFGSQIKLIVNAGKTNRLMHSWEEFSSLENIKGQLKNLYNKFELIAFDNQDLEFLPEELKKFFIQSITFELKNNIPASVIKVTLPDGRIIFYKEAKDVFLKTLEYIGIPKVFASANFHATTRTTAEGLKERVMLIEKAAVGKTQDVVAVNGVDYYIYTGTNTKKKMEQLEEIGERLGMSLNIEQLWI